MMRTPCAAGRTPALVCVSFVASDGARHEIHTHPGGTLMELALANGVAGIDAICGGNCSCGTCRLRIPAPWLARLPAATAAELDVLDCAGAASDGVRLGCQIELTGALDGVTILVQR